MSTQFTFIYVHPEAPGDINDGLVIYQGSRLYDPTPFMTVRAMVVSNKEITIHGTYHVHGPGILQVGIK